MYGVSILQCRSSPDCIFLRYELESLWAIGIHPEERRKQRAFKVAVLTWIVERSFAWLGFNRRLPKDYEHGVQSSETMIDVAAIRVMLNRISQ
jgi:transposase